MICFPNAKINIGLHILTKRSDGYHDIETVMYPIPFHDVLEIVPQHEKHVPFTFKNKNITVETISTPFVKFYSSGIEISDNENNMCIKAYLLLKKDYDLPPVSMYLHKVIPIGAGLGGGSSDAVFTMKLLNTLFDLNISDTNLFTYARQLGSDCAFFVNNKPAIATEKGDVLEDISIDLQKFYITIIKPEISISTSDAYAGIQPEKSLYSLKSNIKLPIEEWGNIIHNDFENSIFFKHNELKKIKETLYTLGAIYTSMSGSGSAFYGIFRHPINLTSFFPECMVWNQKISTSFIY